MSRRLILPVVLVVLAACSAGPKKGSFARFAPGGGSDPLARIDPGIVTGIGDAPDSGPAAMRTEIVHITITDQGIESPDSLPTGTVELHVTNKGKHVHEARLLQLPRGMTAGDAIATIDHDHRLPHAAGFGGAGPVAPGQTVTVTQLLTQPGTYLLVCALPSDDGQPWFTRGLLRIVVLHGSKAFWRQPQILPASAVIITTGTMVRFGAALTRGGKRSLLIEGRWRRTQIPPGDNQFKIEQRSGQGHDLVIMKTIDPLQMHAYVDWLNGDRSDPPPGIIGGIPGLYGPIMTFYIKLLGLAPGTYTIFCPKVHGGVPDFELGEVDQFYVY